MSYPPNQPPPGPGWGGQDQGGWAPQPGPEQGWAPPPGQPPPGPQQWAQPGYGTPPPGVPGGGVPYPTPKKSSPVLPIAIIVVLIAAAAGAFFVFGGGGDDGDPESAATSYINALIDRDCEAMGDVVNLEGQDPAGMLAECQEAVANTEGVSEFLPTELVSTRVVSEEGDSATVAAEVRLGSGDTTTQDLDMTRVDGDWRVNVDPADLGGPSTDDTIPPPDDTSEPDDSTTTTEDEPDSTTTTESSTDTTFEAGTDAEDAANRDACAGGDMAACDDLWYGTPVGSELEAFAETCGGRAPEGGYSGDCEETFG